MKLAKIRDVKTPTRGTERSAGLDFYIPKEFTERYLCPGQAINIPSGIKVRIPEGYALIAMNKSGVALNKNLQVGACVIDEDYQGEIHLHVSNIGKADSKISPGDKLVQFLCMPIAYINIEEVSIEALYTITTSRGENGFGSTGGVIV